MNTSQISRLLYRNKSFLDVYPSDLLPKRYLAQRPVGLVVNTHPHHLPGEHWIAIYLPPEGPGEFFDSYGTAPDDPRLPKTIAKFLEHQAEETVFQQNQLQHPRAVTCGHHCVFFLESRAGGLSFDQILKLYSHDVLKNDRMVIRFVRNRKARLCRKPYGLFQHVQTCCPLCKNQL